MMWDFIQTQILGMKWLDILIGELLSALGFGGAFLYVVATY
jgi:hypothetical protein